METLETTRKRRTQALDCSESWQMDRGQGRHQSEIAGKTAFLTMLLRTRRATAR